MSTIRLPGFRVFFLGFTALFFAGSVAAQVEPDKSGVGQAEFRLDALTIDNQYRLPVELPDQAAANARADLNTLGVGANNGRVDRRSGRWASLIMAKPLIPGRGVGNRLGWADLGEDPPANPSEIKAAANAAVHRFLQTNSAQLRIDLNELRGHGRTTLHRDGEVIQLYMPRVVNGIKVRGSYLTATINNGNLVLFGTQHWGDIDVSTSPKLGSEVAAEAVAAHVAPYLADGSWGKSDLVLVPVARGNDVARVPVGKGYSYRLAWVVRPAFKGDVRRFEALVDAHSGELISFEDTNHYAASAREVRGGVYPVSNDGIDPDGVEQPDWPMPFIYVATPGGTVVTDSGGNLPAPVDGAITAGLSGQYVLMSDYCGSSSLSSDGDIDFGESSGTDCANPGFGGFGNTHASRTGFYELNRIMEMARGQLPGNSWLQQQLKATMNITNSCNAFWNGVTVNFYQSGGGCSNTGELAGVFDHEWGHGIDDNDAVPTIASPSGEGIADIYTALRLNDSCIGRNFRSTNCTGNGDACLSCTGVRDIDYLKRQSGQPHDYSWSNANCGSSVHCIGAVYSEAVWSLWKRNLQSAPYNYDNNTAHEIVNRLTFIGGGNTGTWFSGGPPYGGCAAGSGYLNYLAADDDDGNLGNGTPHMQAIFDAFNDQEIACNTPTVQESGCSDVPTAAPVVNASPLDKSVNLNWDPVSGAAGYEVFRTDGVFACDFGKIKVGETIGTSFNDSGLQNDREYSYVVVPKGSSDACFGPASACTSGSPAAGSNVAIDDDSAVLTTSGGDGDEFIDNCEMGTLTFNINNTGLGGLTDVRITAVDAVSHAGTTVSTFSPTATSPVSIPEGGSASASFDFTAGGLAFGDTLVFEVTLTADEIAPVTKTQTLSLQDAETDRQFLASKTWGFDSDAEGWTVIEGTFDRQSPGASGSAAHLASSANLDNQCDHVRSPVVRLQATSTLTLSNQYEIEGFYTPTNAWYDRANVGIHDESTNIRTAIDPDGGRLYNAGGINGTCGTSGQNGWADSATSWGQSSWSAAALGSAGFAGKPVQIDVRYGTDPSLNGFGFRFDQVTLTNVDLLVPDSQADNCGPPDSDPPVVSITSPGSSTYLQGDSVLFEGTANDDPDGDLGASLSWTSSLDGAIGNGLSFSTDSLSVGTHTITAEVTDSDGGTGSDQVTVTIDNVNPTVSITSPTSGLSVDQGTIVTFTGTATDPGDGDLGNSLGWTSSLDGTIGSGASVSTSTLSVGTHTITADVTDSDGGSDSKQVTVMINNVVPTVSIDSPTGGTQFVEGTSVSFTGSATDPGDGDLSDSLIWTSVPDGTIGSGASFSTSTLSVGTHTITADVTDSDSGSGSDSINIEITASTAESVHVASVVTETINAGRGQKFGVATVTIYNDLDQPVEGYEVSGHFGTPFDTEGTKTKTTDGNGVVTFQTDTSAKGPTVTFCVSSVSGTLAYAPGDNAAGTTCGDEPPPQTGDPTDVHVASVTTGSSGVGGGDKVGTATVLVLDDLGNAAVGYTVIGDFGGDFNETAQGTTGPDGTAVVTTSSTGRGKLTVTFCVSSVSSVINGSLPYDPSDNASGVACTP